MKKQRCKSKSNGRLFRAFNVPGLSKELNESNDITFCNE